MKASEIRELTVAEIVERSKEVREEIFRLKWQKGLNQLDNTAKISNAKRDLARILTILKEKNK